MKGVSNGKCKSQDKTIQFILFLKKARTQYQQIQSKIKSDVFAVKPFYWQGRALSFRETVVSACPSCSPSAQRLVSRYGAGERTGISRISGSCLKLSSSRVQVGSRDCSALGAGVTLYVRCFRSVTRCHTTEYLQLVEGAHKQKCTQETKVKPSKIQNFLLSRNCWYLQREKGPLGLLRCL